MKGRCLNRLTMEPKHLLSHDSVFYILSQASKIFKYFHQKSTRIFFEATGTNRKKDIRQIESGCPFSFHIYNALDQSLNDNNDDQDRKDELEIRLQRPREAKAFALVALFQIFVEAPAELRHAEQQIDQGADWK